MTLKHWMRCFRPLLRGANSVSNSRSRGFTSQLTAMAKTITLTNQEATLKQLLLDVSAYIGTLEGCKKPELRITGGWVRDKLLGLTSHDIDIGIDTMTGFTFGNLMKQYLALPETKAKYKQDILGSLAKIEANPEKSKHLETVTTKILGLDIDLVNLRKETYTEDSRNPTMEFGTPEEDALRRDATVNALFYNLDTSKVEDFTGRGLKDMELEVIKTPLAPLQTFKDDPLRVLRSIRFASRLGYHIAKEDIDAMRDSSIKDALKLKISRERVGVEVTKMLKGPNPYESLKLIDALGLYNDIFTQPTDPQCTTVETGHWHRAYNLLCRLMDRVQASSDEEKADPHICAQILLRNSDDEFFAWMLVCFTPWAKEQSKSPKKQTTKRLPSSACIAAREGIKADNRVSNAVDDAVAHRHEIIAMKEAVMEEEKPRPSSLKRKQEADLRVAQGLAIRRWGSHWRSSVMYALLVQVSEADLESGM